MVFRQCRQLLGGGGGGGGGGLGMLRQITNTLTGRSVAIPGVYNSSTTTAAISSSIRRRRRTCSWFSHGRRYISSESESDSDIFLPNSTTQDDVPFMHESEIFQFMFSDPNKKNKLPRNKKAPKRTALYDFHKDIGCTFTTYNGYEVPLYYHHSQGGIINEHLWCRTPNQASIFDISYLTQYRIFGKDRIHFLERCMTADLKNLPTDHAAFTCLTNEQHSQNDNGTTMMNIIDTGIVSICDDNIYFVVNGDKEIKSRLWKHFETHLRIAAEANTNPDPREKSNISEVPYEYVAYMYTLEKSHSLIAIQGSGAAAALQPLVPSDVRLDQMTYMSGIRTSLMDVESCRITRCGYTGMDGFELSIPHTATEDIVVELLRENPTTLNVAGLGARDILRCESGLLQYGLDIHPQENSMIETGYDRTIPPRRREEGGFLGADQILAQLETPPPKDFPKFPLRSVGIMGMDRIVTANTIIYDGATGNTPIGHVTSGVYSPTLQRPIAIGYVLEEYSSVDTPIQFHMTYKNGRVKKRMNAAIAKMPFVPTQFYRCQRPISVTPVSDTDVEREKEMNEEYDSEDEEMARRRRRRQLLREPDFSTTAANFHPGQVEPYHEIDDDELFDRFYKADDEFLRYSSNFADDDDNDNMDSEPSADDPDDNENEKKQRT